MAWTTDVSTYLRIATGYKAGGISEAGAVGTFNSAFVFEPEEILTYELGLKSMLADDRVRLNMAVFYSEFDDMQLGFNTNPADLSEVLLTNAGEATVGGVEIEGQWAATDDLQFSFNYTYLDPEIDRVDAPAGTIFDPVDNSAVAVPSRGQHRGSVRAAVHIGEQLYRLGGLDLRTIRRERLVSASQLPLAGRFLRLFADRPRRPQSRALPDRRTRHARCAPDVVVRHF